MVSEDEYPVNEYPVKRPTGIFRNNVFEESH